MLNDVWWLREKDAAHTTLHALVTDLEHEQEDRLSANLLALRLYGNRKYTLGSNRFRKNREQLRRDYKTKGERIRFNVVQSVVDTITSKIGKNKPRPMFLTKDGDYTQQRKAKNLGDFVEGVFNVGKFYAEATKAFRDSCIFDIGCLKVFRDNGKIHFEKVYPNEVFIDEDESMFTPPRNMYHIRQVHKEVLLGEYPDFEKQITAIDLGEQSDGVTKDAMLRIIEAWHLPSNNKENGRHIIALENATLVDEDYDKDYFSILVYRWNDATLGYYGQSLTEQLSGIQYEINKLLIRIQDAFHLLAVPMVFIPYGSKVVPSHIRNVTGTFVYYDADKPPNVATPQTVNPEVFQHLDRLYSRAFEIAGISQLSANSQKPSGLDSGIALRTFHDIETERFVTTGQMYESMALDAARIVLDLAREIDESEEEGFKITAKVNSAMQKIKWKEVNIAEDEYLMNAYPISLLPSTPAGQLQMVQELINIGVIKNREDILKLLDYPDFQSFASVDKAASDNIDWVISEILDNNNFNAPEPFQNLELGIQKMQLTYLKSMASNVSEKKLDKMRDWISQAIALLQPPQESQAALPVEAMQAPEAGIPNAPQALPQEIPAPPEQPQQVLS